MSLLADVRLGIIGCGNLGQALLAGLIEAETIAPEQICVTNRRAERSQGLAQKYGVRIATSNSDCTANSDVVLLAVKPQMFPKVLDEISASARNTLLISVAAGVTIKSIESQLGEHPRVVRTMPNTPAIIRQSATAISAGTHANALDLERTKVIFKSVGTVAQVDESQLDAVTGLSGSGPAYIFLLIEAFADAGVKVGLSREVATTLAVQTIQGSARLLQETNEHPGRLKDQVTSPGGTAIAGLHTLEAGGLRTTIMNAVEIATGRAKELGQRTMK